MHLIPLDQTIYFNTTDIGNIALATMCLLSFTYHPSFSNILYLLYGQASGVMNSNYASLYLLARDTNTGILIQNITLSQGYGCNIACQIKATAILFLIESESLIGIYPISNSTYQVNSLPIMTKNKVNTSLLTDIYRLADIYKDKYIIVANNITYFGFVAGTDLTLHSFSVNYSSFDILQVSISKNEFFGAINSPNVSLILYSCLACIFNGSKMSLSISDFLIIPTSSTFTGSFRIYQGYSLNDETLSNSKVYWVRADGISLKYLINRTNFELLQFYISLYQNKSLANNKDFLLYGADHKLNRRSFDSQTSLGEYNLYDYQGYYLSNSYQAYITNAAISDDSTIFAVHSDTNTWNIQQYQIVDNCSLYNASIDSISNLYCSCSQYYANHQCVLLDTGTNITNYTNSTNSTNLTNGTNATNATNLTNQTNAVPLTNDPNDKGSFPLPILIGVVVGLIGVVIAVIVVKKNYKRCTKGRRRTPWKYDPVEIMSFQM